MKTILVLFLVFVLGYMTPSYASVQYSLAECQQKAQTGDAEALWQLTCRYRDGNGVVKNVRKAVSYCRMAAEKGHKQACLYLSELYSKGKFVKKDLEQAASWREKAEAIQDGDSGENPSSPQTVSDEVDIDNNTASTSSRDVEDVVEVALDYLYGRQLHEKNVPLGTALLYNEAKGGNKSAQRVFVQALARGSLNLDDESIEFEFVEAWVENAAREGLAVAFFLKGNLARSNARYADAIKFWKTAWQKGEMRASRSLALIYDRFDVKDEQKEALAPFHSDKDAIFYYEKALEYYKNEVFLMYRLAILKILAKDEKNQDREGAERLLKQCHEQEPKDEIIADIYGRVARANAQVDLGRCNEYYEKKYKQAEREGRYELCSHIRKQWRESVAKIESRISRAKRLIKDDN